jgi:hypothetical protein
VILVHSHTIIGTIYSSAYSVASIGSSSVTLVGVLLVVVVVL